MENIFYKFVQNDPMRFFNVGDQSKPHDPKYTEGELKRFYFNHHPEQETVSIDAVLSWFNSLNAPITQLK